MRKALLVAASLALLCFTVNGLARDAIDDGQLQVKPYKQDRFETGAYRMGKAELFGYIGALKDSDHITGVVLRRGERATVEQKHLIAVIAKAQKINASIELDDELKPLVDPTPPPAQAVTAAPVTAAAPVESATPTAAPASAANSH